MTVPSVPDVLWSQPILKQRIKVKGHSIQNIHWKMTQQTALPSLLMRYVTKLICHCCHSTHSCKGCRAQERLQERFNEKAACEVLNLWSDVFLLQITARFIRKDSHKIKRWLTKKLKSYHRQPCRQPQATGGHQQTGGVPSRWRRWRWDAEGIKRVGCGEEVSPSLWGLGDPPQKILKFYSWKSYILVHFTNFGN